MSFTSFTFKFSKNIITSLLMIFGLLLSNVQLGAKNTTKLFDAPPPLTDTCYYTLELFDSFGDGWNGSVLTANVNGVSTDYTFTFGTEATFVIEAVSNDPIIFTYSAGAFQNEVTYNILDPSGNVIFSDGPFPQTGVVLSIFACPTCPGPFDVFIDHIGGIDADLSWTPADSSGVYLVEYDEAGFTLGTGNMLSTSDTEITLTGLQEDTDYEFYISVACDNGDSSAVIGPVSFKTIWLIDVGVSDILAPLTQCGLSDEETVEVTLKNYGDNPQSLIPFRYSVNGTDAGVQYPVDGFYTGVLSNDSTATLEFETTFDFSEFGEYTIDAWTELENDGDINNDSFSFTITNIPVISDLPYFNDFEDWDGGWKIEETSQNSSWQFGEPVGNDIPNAASGINAWVTNLAGNYNNSELSYIVSPCYDFSDLVDDPVINFSIIYDTELSFDGGWLEGSTDGGMTWTKIGSMGSGVNWYNFNNTFQNLGEVWAGNSNGWLNAENNLIGFAGEADCRFRFAFDSDGSVNSYDGIGVDDIFISPIFEDDLSTLSVDHESMSDCGSEEDHVIVEIRNAGSNGQTGFDVSYQVNGGDIVTENVGLFFVNPGLSDFYTFSTPFDSKQFGTDFEIVAWTDLDDELNFVNDTASFEFSTITPDALPLVEDFENVAIPAGWVTTAGFVTNLHNNVSYVYATNLYAGIQNVEITSTNIGPINPGDSLTFDYRYVDWSAGTNPTTLGAGDFLEIQISPDCGDSYTTVFTIDQNNHVPSAVMTNRLIDLDQFAGEVIKIRFVGQWGSGDYWLDIDNINIIGCPQSFGLEQETIYESSVGESDGSISVNPTQGQEPYTYEWDSGDDTPEISNLPAGNYTLTITDANGCMEVTTFGIGICPDNLDLSADVTGVSGPGAMDGEVTILANSGEGPYTYEWSNGDSTSVAGGLAFGEYDVTVTDVHGCSDIINVMVGIEVGIEDLNISTDISLIPNPTSGSSNLNIELSQAADVQVHLLNVVGQKLFFEESQNTSSLTIPLNLSNLPEGVYFVHIQIEDKIFIEKLVRAK